MAWFPSKCKKKKKMKCAALKRNLPRVVPSVVTEIIRCAQCVPRMTQDTPLVPELTRFAHRHLQRRSSKLNWVHYIRTKNERKFDPHRWSRHNRLGADMKHTFTLPVFSAVPAPQTWQVEETKAGKNSCSGYPLVSLWTTVNESQPLYMQSICWQLAPVADR